MAKNINKNLELTSDIYGINSYVNNIKKRFTPGVNEDTLLLGIFGYTGQVLSDMIQNSIIMASEFANESIPTKAKFERNVIAHAMSYGLKDINATPAQFDVILTFVEDDIISWYKSKTQNEGSSFDGSWTFTFDREIPMMVENYEFHSDYDITIKKIKIANNKYAYTAMYDIDTNNPNPISDIANPYLASPVKVSVDGIDYIFVRCTLHQVEKNYIHKKILNDNIISAKTFSFEFEGQLAAFTIDAKDGSTVTKLTPVYEGLLTNETNYFFYTYLDSNTIRIKFDRNSYIPKLNSEITVNIQTTCGEDGNFIYKPERYPIYSIESDKYGYSNIGCQLRPITGESLYGADKKSIKELKEYIPKEALARGSITNISDLYNFFNMIDNDYSKLYLYKKRDNALERLYYTYLIMKDRNNNVIPTNTIDLKFYRKDLVELGGYKYILKRGEKINLIKEDSGKYYGKVDDGVTSSDFSYKIPYNLIINLDPLYGMYYLSTINTTKFLDFTYINDKCLYQYIATNIQWKRGYVEDPNKYIMTIDMEQNIDTDEDTTNTIQYSETENIADVRCIAVIYDKDDNPVRWSEGIFISHNSDTNVYRYKFEFTTEDYIDDENNIAINGLNQVGSTTPATGRFASNMKCIIHILSKQDKPYGLNGLSTIVPGLTDYTLSNSYNVTGGIDFFYNYSDICNSVVTVGKDEDGTDNIVITDVPVVRYNSFTTEDDMEYLCNELIKRKNYIKYAITLLEDAFSINMKFLNTYGPSNLFTTDEGPLDKVNIDLKFRVKLRANYSTNIINEIISDIKAYIEDISEIRSLHIPTLVSEINLKYNESIVYFEFRGINNYGPHIQHLYASDMPDSIIVPEFINIDTTDGITPNITITLV